MKSLEELETETLPQEMIDEGWKIYDEIQTFDEKTSQEILKKLKVRLTLWEMARDALGLQNQINMFHYGRF
jgi:hypothetical protein